MTPEQGIEQAEVMRRWYEQKALPESEREILEVKPWESAVWTLSTSPSWDFSLREYRLRKRPKTKTVTVYLYRAGEVVLSCLNPGSNYRILGQADITYEEPCDDTK